MAEAVVVAGEQQAHAKPVVQHLCHKLTGGQGLQLGREGQHLDAVDAGLADESQLLGKGCQHLFAARRVVEGDAQRLQRAPPGLLHHLAQHEAVS